MAKRAKNDDGIEYVGFAIYEVYYEDDKPVSCTESDISPHAWDEKDNDPVKDLQKIIEWMLEACNKPILDYDNFPNEYKNIPKLRRKKLNKLKNVKK